MKCCFNFDKTASQTYEMYKKNRCLMMPSLLKLFVFQSGESSGEESEYSRRSSSCRADGNVEQLVQSFMSADGVLLTVFKGVRGE